MPDTESPPVMTVGRDDLHKRGAELLRWAEATGGAVRVLHGQQPERVIWISAEPPQWYGELIADDTAALQRLAHGYLRRVRNFRRAAHA